MTTPQPHTGGPREQLVELARHGDTVLVQDREPWRIGQLGENFRHSAVLILFGALDRVPSAYAEHSEGPGRDLDVLLVQRASTLRAHPGQVAFPGGRLDPPDGELGTTLEFPGGTVSAPHVRAALREAHEETGLDPSGVEVLGALHEVPLPVSNHMVTPVIGWWCSPSPVDVVDHAESSLVFRVPVLDLINPAHRYYATVTRGNQTYKSPAFDLSVAGVDGTVTVWGFTGVVLDRVLDRLGWAVEWDRSVKRPAPGMGGAK
ncbi:CoA pyrophosphatase [Kocuria sp.]|uniref:NUDIX hydrolase n=1 Tax=Kocuria sp. TaxID=1871328 RepID=UPI0026DC0574|nr:CoA pyrophosphatase [Kocuria sp.]MDO4918291.1 CoA pyrophosphatase [Kocuria sp.]